MMRNDSIRIKAEGKVSVGDLRIFVDAFSELLSVLMQESGVSKKIPIEWFVSDIKGGSVMLVSTAAAEGDEAIRSLPIVIEKYRDLARNAAVGHIEQYSSRIQAPVRMLAGLVNGHVTNVLMGVENDPEDFAIDKSLRTFDDEAVVDVNEPILLHTYVRTAIKGQIITLDKKHGIYFTLRRAYTNEDIRCYPSRNDKETQKKIARCWDSDTWVIIEGTFGQTNKSPTLYNITHVEELPQAERGAWRQAVGGAPRDEQGLKDSAAEMIRKVRNGEA